MVAAASCRSAGVVTCEDGVEFSLVQAIHAAGIALETFLVNVGVVRRDGESHRDVEWHLHRACTCHYIPLITTRRRCPKREHLEIDRGTLEIDVLSGLIDWQMVCSAHHVLGDAAQQHMKLSVTCRHCRIGTVEEHGQQRWLVATNRSSSAHGCAEEGLVPCNLALGCHMLHLQTWRICGFQDLM